MKTKISKNSLLNILLTVLLIAGFSTLFLGVFLETRLIVFVGLGFLGLMLVINPLVDAPEGRNQ